MTDPPEWRPVIAALGNRDARRVYARLVMGHEDAFADLSPSRAAHVRTMLAGAGLTTGDAGAPSPDEGVFARILSRPRPRPAGVQRFLRADGRVDRYPSSTAERLELLELIAGRVLVDGEVLSERELNERLANHADDVALLRRHLVDHEVLERTPSGSQYARV